MTDNKFTLTREVSISPLVINELLDSIEDMDVDKEITMRHLVQEVISNGRIFISRFEDTYFLKSEPIHEFIGLTFRDQETSRIEQEVRFRLICSPKSMGIFSPEELEIDPMYDVRLLIAESQMPEFQNDTFPRNLPKDS